MQDPGISKCIEGVQARLKQVEFDDIVHGRFWAKTEDLAFMGEGLAQGPQTWLAGKGKDVSEASVRKCQHRLL